MSFIYLWLLQLVADFCCLTEQANKVITLGFFGTSVEVSCLVWRLFYLFGWLFFPPSRSLSLILPFVMSTRICPTLALPDRSSRCVERCSLCTQQCSLSFTVITDPALLARDLHVRGQLQASCSVEWARKCVSSCWTCIYVCFHQ